MASPVLAWLAFGAALLGFAWLSLAMPQHWSQARGPLAPPLPAGRQAALRASGATALAAALALCLCADTTAMAVMVWLMLLPAAALLVALILEGKPRLLRLLWRA